MAVAGNSFDRSNLDPLFWSWDRSRTGPGHPGAVVPMTMRVSTAADGSTMPADVTVQMTRIIRIDVVQRIVPVNGSCRHVVHRIIHHRWRWHSLIGPSPGGNCFIQQPIIGFLFLRDWPKGSIQERRLRSRRRNHFPRVEICGIWPPWLRRWNRTIFEKSCWPRRWRKVVLRGGPDSFVSCRVGLRIVSSKRIIHL